MCVQATLHSAARQCRVKTERKEEKASKPQQKRGQQLEAVNKSRFNNKHIELVPGSGFLGSGSRSLMLVLGCWFLVLASWSSVLASWSLLLCPRLLEAAERPAGGRGAKPPPSLITRAPPPRASSQRREPHLPLARIVRLDLSMLPLSSLSYSQATPAANTDVTLTLANRVRQLDGEVGRAVEVERGRRNY